MSDHHPLPKGDAFNVKVFNDSDMAHDMKRGDQSLVK